MDASRIRRALISTYDKTGVVDFARALTERHRVEILSTGGTAVALRDNGIKVTPVEDVTGFGAMLDGRVKTLHPSIHAAILADRHNPDHMRQLAEAGIEPIDMVVVNLYPFEQTISEPECTRNQAIEMIDIGGPCMLRAAAKNHAHVVIVARPADYEFVLAAMDERGGQVSDDLKRRMATAAFELTSRYDRTVAAFLNDPQSPADALPATLALSLSRAASMRYGENPHQSAGWYQDMSSVGAVPRLVGDDDTSPAMSYNNYLDANAAIGLCADLLANRVRPFSPDPAPRSADQRPAACVLVKHNNPCGAGVGRTPIEAYRRAYLGDPLAAMGGILACSHRVDEQFATTVMNSLTQWGKDAGAGAFFVEVWIAPSFTADAIRTIRTSKKWGARVRLLEYEFGTNQDSTPLLLRSAAGGVLVQTADVRGCDLSTWRVVTKRQPTDREVADLKLAWICVKHVRSNAIALTRHGQLLAAGAGQMSRVVSCKLALDLAIANGHLDSTDGDRCHCVAASDAFFPFRDGPDRLMDGGVTAIIQPGGSKRDEDTIAACNERGVAMIHTGTRHFRH